MKNNGAKFKIFLTSFLLAMIFILPIFVFAKYELLEPLPGYTEPAEGKSQLTAYLSALFNFAIAAAAILAVVMIVIGGLQYIGAAGNTSVIEDAKDRIYWAIVGLILALGSWLILYNINPELKELELKGVKMQTIKPQTPTTTTTTTTTTLKTTCEAKFEYMGEAKTGSDKKKTTNTTQTKYSTEKECEDNCQKDSDQYTVDMGYIKKEGFKMIDYQCI